MDTFDTPFEFHSKMNPSLDKISSDKFPNPDDIFDQLDEDDENESSYWSFKYLFSINDQFDYHPLTKMNV